MKTLIFAFLLVAAGAAHADQTDLCEEKWGTDYEMVAYCIDNQNDAIDTYNGLLDRAARSTVRQGIMVNCVRKWTKKHTDWEMVVYCAENQIEAAQNLGKLEGREQSSRRSSRPSCMYGADGKVLYAPPGRTCR